MAESILGLPSSAKFAAEGDRFYNHRRKILHYYPNGGAPLTGLLSMIPEESVNDSIFYWYEKRYQSPKSTLRGTAPWTSSAPSTGDADDGTTAGTGAKAIATVFYLKVASTVSFKVGDIVRLDTTGVQFWITAVTRGVSAETTNGYLTVKLIRAYTIAATSEFASGTVIRVVGSAYGEGASGTGLAAKPFKRPYAIMNTTQIFRDKMEFPGSVLQMGLKYDDTGPYQEKARDTIIDHMTSIERAILFGKRSTTTRTSFDSSQEDLTVRTMSGIIEFLELWDAGSTGLSIDGATYAPYAQKGASTLDSDDEKRIITNADGLVTVDRFNMWAERIGRYAHNRTKEKLVLCGSGAMNAFVKMFRKNSTFQVRYGEKAYGLTLVTLTTPYGDFHLVTHPLFNEDATMRYWALMVDIWSLKYRYLTNRDTRLLKMRQNPGDDFRRDEYLTEASIEFWQPEGNMLVKNIQDYVD
jgi:hypothetical protein